MIVDCRLEDRVLDYQPLADASGGVSCSGEVGTSGSVDTSEGIGASQCADVPVSQPMEIVMDESIISRR